MLSTDIPVTSRSSRIAGALGATVLQAGFVLMFIYSVPKLEPAPATLEREFALILPRVPMATRPPVRPLTRPGVRTPAPLLPPQAAVRVPTTPPILSIPNLRNFGQALNDCAPEIYNKLTPDQRILCPSPGAGAAIQEEPSLLGTPNHAQDEALWQEQWTEDHWRAGLCDPSEEPTVALCQIHQSIAEFERAEDVRWHLARDKASALKEPMRPLPKGVSN